MIPRRAAIFGVVAAAAFAAYLGIRPPRADLPPAAAPDTALGLLAGAFRPIVADALWMRLLAHEDAGEYDDMLPIAETLLALDPRFERAWAETAWTLGVDIPAFEDDPDAVWRWRRQGLLLIGEGARKNPGSWYLRFEEGLLVDLEIARFPAIAERFRADRTADPEGIDAAECARRRYREALELPHPARTDRLLRRVLEHLEPPPLAPPGPK